MLNYDFIRQKSVESKIDGLTIEREYWQLLFLQRLYYLKDSANIFFKGGTAIRFLFNSFRFSEDLDFTAALPKKEAEKLLIEVFLFFQKNAAVPLEFKKEEIIKKKLSLYPHLRFSIKKLIESINAFDDKELKRDLNQFLPEQYRQFYRVIKKETLRLL